MLEHNVVLGVNSPLTGDVFYTLQVLQVSLTEIQGLCSDPQARTSPLLCLSQTPSLNFLQPVKVQIPLPSGVTGS